MIFKESKSNTASLLLGALILVAIGLWGAVLSGHAATSEALYFFSVGQGDSSFVQLASGVQILIDGGPSGKALLENLAQVMPAQDRYIDLVIMSHPQLDHFGGLIEVLKKYEVGAFLGSGRKGSIGEYKELHRQITAHAVPYIEVREGDVLALGDSKISILGPSPSEVLSGELNDTMVVALLETPTIKALYTGDIGFSNEERISKQYDIDVDVLKVGHHGSRFSSGENFLKKVAPAIAVIEVGKNTYGHPTKAALDRLAKYTKNIFRTDQQGSVKVVAEANTLSVFNLK
jgi:competence protein ComEC